MVEAEIHRVVELVAEHAVEKPERSLGVITANVDHQERIEAALRRASIENPPAPRRATWAGPKTWNSTRSNGTFWPSFTGATSRLSRNGASVAIASTSLLPIRTGRDASSSYSNWTATRTTTS
jgi:hypothetical protein